MNLFPALPVLPSLLLTALAIAQNAAPLAPSGQPALAAIRPTLRNTLPLPVVEVAGNAAFAVHAAVVTPLVPAGSPMFLLLGFPTAPSTLGAPLLFPGYGLPGILAMPNVVAGVYVGVAGTLGNPPFPLPLPPGLGPLGIALSTQIAVFVPGGLGLTGATGIVI
jgi:hypothetical protein